MNEILSIIQRQRHATDAGAAVHKKLEFATADDEIIKSHPELAPFFGPNAKTEVPIAGIIDGKFISRRIDRLVPLAGEGVDGKAGRGGGIYFMDYKTDTDKTRFYDQYVAQIREYSALLRAAYPGHNVHGFILWTNDFTLEEIK